VVIAGGRTRLPARSCRLPPECPLSSQQVPDQKRKPRRTHPVTPPPRPPCHRCFWPGRQSSRYLREAIVACGGITRRPVLSTTPASPAAADLAISPGSPMYSSWVVSRRCRQRSPREAVGGRICIGSRSRFRRSHAHRRAVACSLSRGARCRLSLPDRLPDDWRTDHKDRSSSADWTGIDQASPCSAVNSPRMLAMFGSPFSARS